MKRFGLGYLALVCLLGDGCATTGAGGAGATGGSPEADAYRVAASGAPTASAETDERDHPTAESTGPLWMDGTHPEDLPAQAYLVGVGVGDDMEAARVAAIAALLVEGLGPVEERPDVELPELFNAAKDTIRQESVDDGRTAVLAAVSKALFALRLQAWLDDPMKLAAADASKPQDQLGAMLAFLRYQQVQAFGCQRLKVIAEGDCQPADDGLAKKQVTKVATELQLLSAFDGGVPFREGVGALRPATVRAMWKNGVGDSVPWPGLPLRFSGPEMVLSKEFAKTDHQGRAEVAFAMAPAQGMEIKVEVDRQSLLGRHADLWPEVGTKISLRRVHAGSGRVAVALAETIAGEPSHDKVAVNATVLNLKDLGHQHARVLPDELAATLSGGADRRRALGRIADNGGGVIDLVAVGTAVSEFADRMGGRSIWHEAVATITLYDVWTGAEVAVIERSTRAVGIGDHNAGRKALRDLGSFVAQAVHELLVRD